jgi:hypothetical protein
MADELLTSLVCFYGIIYRMYYTDLQQ